MATVDLTPQEWQQVMAMISSAPWRDANPILMRIGEQLQAQHAELLKRNMPVDADANSPGGNGQESHHVE